VRWVAGLCETKVDGHQQTAGIKRDKNAQPNDRNTNTESTTQRSLTKPTTKTTKRQPHKVPTNSERANSNRLQRGNTQTKQTQTEQLIGNKRRTATGQIGVCWFVAHVCAVCCVCVSHPWFWLVGTVCVEREREMYVLVSLLPVTSPIVCSGGKAGRVWCHDAESGELKWYADGHSGAQTHINRM